MKSLSRPLLLKALAELDSCLPEKLELLVGGGGAMVLAYGETEGTHDFDAVPVKSTELPGQLRPFFLRVAEKLDLAKDWVNTYFGTFTTVLPADFRDRVREVYAGRKLRCVALGPEDLLVMKLMAGRPKDDRHIRRLMKWKGIELGRVEKRLEELAAGDHAGAREALDRLDEFREALGIA